LKILYDILLQIDALKFNLRPYIMLIFMYTIFCSAMVAHLMLGSMNESFATLQVGWCRLRHVFASTE